MQIKSTDLRRGILTRQMQEARDLLIETDLAVVMKDAYPKAQYHFLIVPKEEIANVTELTREHLPLLDHMKELANQIIERQQNVPSNSFLIGFKMDAFMNRLTMHVISDDFYSKSLRRDKHWHSFNTDLFLTYQAAYALLRVQGSIEPMPTERAKELREAKSFHCNQCDFESQSLLGLKVHLFEHWKKRQVELKIKNEVEKVTRMLDEAKLEVKPNQELKEALTQAIDQPKSPTTSENKPSVSTSFELNRKPQNWRQSQAHQPAEPQPPVPYPNAFGKHYQKMPYKPTGGAQYQPHQGNINNIPGHQPHPRFAPPEFRQFNQQTPNGPRPFMNGPNSGFNRQPVRPNYNPRFNQFKSNYPMNNGNNTGCTPIHNEQQNQAAPRFNPFKQSPRMAHPDPNGMQNKPQINPRPQHHQAQNRTYNRPENFNSQHNQSMQNKHNPRPKFPQNMGLQDQSKN